MFADVVVGEGFLLRDGVSTEVANWKSKNEKAREQSKLQVM